MSYPPCCTGKKNHGSEEPFVAGRSGAERCMGLDWAGRGDPAGVGLTGKEM